MRINVITIFPEFFDSPLQVSLVGRAAADGTLVVNIVDLRPFGKGFHRQLDDAPFGGGPGMVMMVEPLAEALAPFDTSHRVLLAAAGQPLTQERLDAWAAMDELTLVCGRYEGVDQRIADRLIEEEISLGDYVLLGGEVGALAIVEGVTRLLPGVVGNPESLDTESFRTGLLEEPQYTRPAEFAGWAVPEVLLSGDHGKVEQWRQEQRIARTRERRPEMLEHHLAAEADEELAQTEDLG
ncbi:MAG: tRNA (guanosine(37)-N1)-methyltransferase TrmD [Actinomycetota bacterium]|nr:tRNA (guanosine(37)-N1)-methyltransferase TrmD [Actinomycetota bacterium]